MAAKRKIMFSPHTSIISASATISTNFDLYFVSAATGNITLTVPNITIDGQIWIIRRTDSSSNTLTIQTTSQNIDGGVSIALGVRGNIVIVSVSGHFQSFLGNTISPTGPTLAGLQDVTITSPANNQTLVYNSGKWINVYARSCSPMAELSYNVVGGGYAIVITTQNTYYELAPPTTFTSNNAEFISNKFSSPSNGKLTYLGATTEFFHVAVSMSSATANAGDSFRIQFWKNGSTIAGSVYSIDYVSNNKFLTVAIHKVVQLATNDTVSVAVTDASSNGKSIIVENFNYFLMSCCSINA